MEALTRSWDGGSREQALVWPLCKDEPWRCARCGLDPLGRELRVAVNDDVLRSQAYRDGDDVLQK